ncbi:YciI family protein [Streptomyces sp. NPDC127084]|uniref:YciI family protein n=1 Tax=Streptomyces sp. NPDC127084 TaxID=3347133 RepID=UPI0036596CAC
MPRYLSMIRVNESEAPAEGPSPELMERMGVLIEEMTKAGVLLDTAGLTPAAQGKRVTWSGGKIVVTEGPFAESEEVIGGYALIQAEDEAEALEWTKRFLQTHETFWTITCEVRQIAEG